MRNQYLHLSAYLCDLCAEPVIAGSLGVRESEISKESGDQFSGSDLRAVRSTARIRQAPLEGSAILSRLNGRWRASKARATWRPPTWKRSIVQNYVEQGAVDLEGALRSPGIVNESHFPEPVHEEAYS
jgi:hypothetical protein